MLTVVEQDSEPQAKQELADDSRADHKDQRILEDGLEGGAVEQALVVGPADMARMAGIEAHQGAVGEAGVDRPNGGRDKEEAEQTGCWQQSADQGSIPSPGNPHRTAPPTSGAIETSCAISGLEQTGQPGGFLLGRDYPGGVLFCNFGVSLRSSFGVEPVPLPPQNARLHNIVMGCSWSVKIVVLTI